MSTKQPKVELSRKRTKIFGIIAITGAFLGILADILSGWSTDPNSMNTAISITYENIKGIYLNKPRWQFILGNYLGIIFIPLHGFGIYLWYTAIKPSGKIKSEILLYSGLYLTALGAGFHGTFAFVGDIIQSNDDQLANNMLDYWQPWGFILIIGYLILSIYLAWIIIKEHTFYNRKHVFLSPISIMIISTIFVFILPDKFVQIKSFLTVTGLNLPLMVWHVITTITLLQNISKESNENVY